MEPPAGGIATQRHEYARIPHRDKTIVGRYLPDLDPDPDKANLCCNQAFTGRTIPDKLILRSGWNPGDFFALVELAPTTFPICLDAGPHPRAIGTECTGASPPCPASKRVLGTPTSCHVVGSEEPRETAWLGTSCPEMPSIAGAGPVPAVSTPPSPKFPSQSLENL